jgi:CRP/FNR family transcriptional regulator, cyclic AMP receptor protein
MRTRTDHRVLEYQALPLFAGCSRSQLRQIARAATRLDIAAGTALVDQGERVRQFVIVVRGTAEVRRDALPVDQIGVGGYFGEIALIRQVREPTSIAARTAMTVDVVARQEFAALYADVPLVRERIDQELSRRIARWFPASDARPFPALDHVAVTVPNLDDHVERLTTTFGRVAEFRSDWKSSS